jgi:ubiquitin-conjugating enzyme E2 variant
LTGVQHPIVARQRRALLAFKCVALAAALLLLALLVSRVALSIQGPGSAALALSGLLAGYAAADLLSGTVHWFCDTFFDVNSPVIGERLIFPFRDHHHNPSAIVEFSFLEQDGSNYVLFVPIMTAVVLGSSAPYTGIPLAGTCALVGLACGAMGTNLFHKWAHAERVPPGVRLLQRWRIILPPRAHDVHHREYRGAYCVTSGWLNRPLDYTRFFERLTSLIRWMFPRSNRKGTIS